jgi:aspartyl-tRNA(Asn)/glutamyl-tRNA(Gln) amidotransferase subunit B
VTLAIRFGLAVGGEIDARSGLRARTYFYPDLAEGIPDHAVRPLDRPGRLPRDLDGERRAKSAWCGPISRKMRASRSTTTRADVPDTVTLVEWNSRGRAAARNRFEPDLRSSAEAMAYLTEMRRSCDADQRREHGGRQLRCDANVSCGGPSRIRTAPASINMKSI